MGNLSFDISTSKDFYHKLIEDYEDYKLDPTSSRLAINCAMTAWHLFEWVYNEFKTSLQGTFGTIDIYRDHLKANECPSLETMHRITNGSKHFLTSKPTDKIQGTEKHLGPFSSAFSAAFDQTSLLVELDNGNKIQFSDELENVVTFWGDYIPKTFGLTL